MDSRIERLLEKIDVLNRALREEYERLARTYGFSSIGKRIVFKRETDRKNAQFRIPAWRYAIPTNIRHFISIPIIYAMIIPAVILDVFFTIFNWTALPLYRIPPVKRREYIVYDRQFLSYLNIIQKFNCIYCTYVNGLLAYASEIAARTERYWCPVKAARKPSASHGWYKDFADYGNPEEWEKKFNDAETFRCD